MANPTLSKAVLKYLRALAKNNDRPWFNEHKEAYQAVHEEMIVFAEALRDQLGQHDELVPASGKKTLMRIYRDTRFSKDKTPYKKHFGGGFTRATKWKRGGYYFHIEPGASFVGGGFWAPNPADLKRMRQEIAADPDSMRKLISTPDFIKTFGELKGDQVKTSPKGYSKDDPAIDLLRYKQFLLSQEYTDAEVTSSDFIDKLVNAFRNMRPFFDYMSEVLTTDENGVPIE